LLNFGDVIM